MIARSRVYAVRADATDNWLGNIPPPADQHSGNTSTAIESCNAMSCNCDMLCTWHVIPKEGACTDTVSCDGKHSP